MNSDFRQAYYIISTYITGYRQFAICGHRTIDAYVGTASIVRCPQIANCPGYPISFIQSIAGKVRYSLDEGNSKRVELIKQFKVVDTLSERVAVARSTSPAQQKVQAHIKAAFRSYLQDNLHTTSPLPELKELKELQYPPDITKFDGRLRN
eukprot:sb/3473469/